MSIEVTKLLKNRQIYVYIESSNYRKYLLRFHKNIYASYNLYDNCGIPQGNILRFLLFWFTLTIFNKNRTLTLLINCNNNNDFVKETTRTWNIVFIVKIYKSLTLTMSAWCATVSQVGSMLWFALRFVSSPVWVRGSRRRKGCRHSARRRPPRRPQPRQSAPQRQRCGCEWFMIIH